MLDSGITYVRGRSGSRLRSAASEIGANAYMIAVVPVTTLTSLFQDGNGPRAASPTTKATRIETTGVPFLLTDASTLGISRSSPSA